MIVVCMYDKVCWVEEHCLRSGFRDVYLWVVVAHADSCVCDVYVMLVVVGGDWRLSRERLHGRCRRQVPVQLKETGDVCGEDGFKCWVRRRRGSV